MKVIFLFLLSLSVFGAPKTRDGFIIGGDYFVAKTNFGPRGNTYKGRIGWAFNHRFTVEGGWFYTGVEGEVVNDRGAGPRGTSEVKHRLAGPELNFRFHPFRWIYLKAGYGHFTYVTRVYNYVYNSSIENLRMKGNGHMVTGAAGLELFFNVIGIGAEAGIQKSYYLSKSAFGDDFGMSGDDFPYKDPMQFKYIGGFLNIYF